MINKDPKCLINQSNSNNLKKNLVKIIKNSLVNSISEIEKEKEKESFEINKTDINKKFKIYNNDKIESSLKTNEIKSIAEFAPSNVNNYYYEIKSFPSESLYKQESIFKYKNNWDSQEKYSSSKNSFETFNEKININNNNNNDNLNYINNQRLITYETSVSNMYHIDQFFEMGNFYKVFLINYSFKL